MKIVLALVKPLDLCNKSDDHLGKQKKMAESKSGRDQQRTPCLDKAEG